DPVCQALGVDPAAKITRAHIHGTHEGSGIGPASFVYAVARPRAAAARHGQVLAGGVDVYVVEVGWALALLAVRRVSAGQGDQEVVDGLVVCRIEAEPVEAAAAEFGTEACHGIPLAALGVILEVVEVVI